ncbi:MAG: SDR family NAD(P)-dependent oxidoreductase, partial [Pirellulales bacterium]|nr:SDR family NAD(P)-dependent oxidoreductase [Pirellulales bacterium]
MEQQPVAVVTGASRGIGRAIASKLATCGFNVVVNFVQSEDRAASLVAEI